MPSLLAGAARRPLPADLGSLELLSLAGQALRLERPPVPESFSVDVEIRDDRAILPDRLRRPLIRLLASEATGHPALALARAFDQLRMRPHPFDLPHIESFIRACPERLGATAEHWLDRQKPASETRGFFDEEAISDANWTRARLSRRVAFLEARRRADPVSARTLLESGWAHEPADARFRLLQVLEIGLSHDDQPFLTSLEKDRAPRVRTLASRFLDRLGAGGQNAAVQACLERITKSQTGLLRKRPALKLDVPANRKDQALSQWVRETFSEASFAGLARALELPEEELIEAADKQDHLLLGLGVLATVECRLDLLQLVVARLPNLWERICESGLGDLGRMSFEQRQGWAEILAKPYQKNLPTDFFVWEWLHRVADCPLSPPPMDLLTQVASPDMAWLELLAAICPSSARPALRGKMSAFDPMITVNAFALLDILDGMEKP